MFSLCCLLVVGSCALLVALRFCGVRCVLFAVCAYNVRFVFGGVYCVTCVAWRCVLFGVCRVVTFVGCCSVLCDVRVLFMFYLCFVRGLYYSLIAVCCLLSEVGRC